MMEIIRIDHVDPFPWTNHEELDAQNLSAIVWIEGRLFPENDVEVFDFVINPTQQVELDIWEAKRQTAIDRFEAKHAAWENREAARLATIQTYELALAEWQDLYDQELATLEEKPRLAEWPAEEEPVYVEPTNRSNEMLVRLAVQAWLDEGNRIPAFSAPEPDVEAIKIETARRINEFCPDWKQRNLTARAAELAMKGPENWTPEEQAEVAAGQAIWDHIKAIRAVSNDLESRTPRPSDYATNEAYWP